MIEKEKLVKDKLENREYQNMIKQGEYKNDKNNMIALTGQ